LPKGTENSPKVNTRVRTRRLEPHKEINKKQPLRKNESGLRGRTYRTPEEKKTRRTRTSREGCGKKKPRKKTLPVLVDDGREKKHTEEGGKKKQEVLPQEKVKRRRKGAS